MVVAVSVHVVAMELKVEINTKGEIYVMAVVIEAVNSLVDPNELDEMQSEGIVEIEDVVENENGDDGESENGGEVGNEIEVVAENGIEAEDQSGIEGGEQNEKLVVKDDESEIGEEVEQNGAVDLQIGDVDEN